MTDDWELRALKRELEGLERRVDGFEKKERQRSERLNWWIVNAIWTLWVIAMTAYVVLAVTRTLGRH